MSLVKWNQPTKLTGRRNWVENFFLDTNDFLKNFDFDKDTAVPAVNVKEEPEFFQIEIAAPGMKKTDFKIEIQNGVLVMSAKSEELKEEKEDNFMRREFNFRNFSRSFWMPENVKSDAIKATYEQGVLKLILPKMNIVPTPATKFIPIN
jgi:HSP20 family protein